MDLPGFVKKHIPVLPFYIKAVTSLLPVRIWDEGVGDKRGRYGEYRNGREFVL
jgi:hypothetical protein